MVSVSSTLGSEKKGGASAPALVLLNKFDAARVEEALNYARLHAADHILDTQEPAIQHMLAVADLIIGRFQFFCPVPVPVPDKNP